MAISPQRTPSARAILAGELLLADLDAGEITQRPSGLLRTGGGGGLEARGQALGEGGEVFDQDAAGVEIGLHDRGLEEMAQRAAQTQPVEAGQNPCDRRAEAVKKSRRDAGVGGRSLRVHRPNFCRTARRSATLVAAPPRYASALKMKPERH
jgi:hypothetical protein